MTNQPVTINTRAAYNKQVLPELARGWGEEFGSDFSVQSLSNYRQLYLTFPNFSALRRNLTCTHYKSLLRISNPQARDWYATEAELERDRALLELN